MFYGLRVQLVSSNQILKLFALNIVKIYQMGQNEYFKLIKESTAQMYPESFVTFCLSNI